MADQLAEIKARSQQLIGLPWRWSRDERPRRYLIEGRFIRVGIVETEQEADFIVHAPTDIDWLVAEVERLRGDT